MSAHKAAWPKYKRMVWTGAFAAVTFVGTIYGAGLKTKLEFKEVYPSSNLVKAQSGPITDLH